MMEWIGSYFLRPGWLLALPFVVALWFWLNQTQDSQSPLQRSIAPHLLRHLVVIPKKSSWFRPHAVLLPAWCLMVIALAGPSWRIQPNPFADDEAGLMIVLHVSESMTSPDLPPSRLERSRIKLNELLKTRANAPTGLVVYNGSAHLVMPMTSDAAVIDHMLQALRPNIMPQDGDALASALRLANEQIADQPGSGSILLVTDSVTASQVDACAAAEIKGFQVWAPLADDGALDASGVQALRTTMRAPVLLFSGDDSDVATIARRLESQMTSVDQQDTARRADDGYWFVPALVIVGLLWSRKGWSLKL